MKLRIFAAAVGMTIAGFAVAQTVTPMLRGQIHTVQPSVQPQLAVDPVAELQSRVKLLTGRINALQTRVDELAVRASNELTFQCTDNQTSVSSKGVEEGCAPYACDYQIGRCRKIAATTNDCAPGYAWVSGGECESTAPH